MTKSNDRAFPSDSHKYVEPNFGLTTREYMATKALQGLLVNAGRNGLQFEDAAEEAVRQADLLIKALSND